ncbi:MAG TPA: hypothetical protein VMJ30_10180 [Gemmatimonadales bacterium]|nr:hypothetical protein [Gemmatimonadales bacterium]
MMLRRMLGALLLLGETLVSAAHGQMARPSAPNGVARLPVVTEVVNGRVEPGTYQGVQAVRLLPDADMKGKDAGMFGILDLPEFRNGTIEIQVAGKPAPSAAPDSRGFIGVSFRTGEHGAWSEIFYLRPTNGRADDQVRRNHAVQYVSEPEWPWYRLRKEAPGVYESYADLVAGEWTRMRIEVDGVKARLYVNGATQPCLVVNDLKHGNGAGHIALWAYLDTDNWFGPITVTPR